MTLYQYNLGSEIPFSSIDYGFINETPTTPSEDHGDLAVVAQTTIAPDDIVSTYSGSQCKLFRTLELVLVSLVDLM